ncbi:flavin-containing monooxygenase [Marinobacter sp. SBS5]|uniref:flavin-containing monooxygenase n=1 Tax=Marinobacter sp. SBS5 TaxID=3401754 RepID=UPI003AAE5358
MNKHVDVLIIGAGLSGIGAAAHLRRNCPGKTFAILESRSSMGGTWDLFRYPGIRSDSDMFTLGYSFKPWTSEKSIADGASILNYIKETSQEYNITQHIAYGMKVVRVEWSSEKAQWKVIATLEGSEEEQIFTCCFLMGCTGYYNYDAGYTPEFPGLEKFKGDVVHPQKWTDDIQYKDKKVVIIGSGATAVTLLPAMCDQAEHVTMLQRSPSYVAAVPEKDHISIGLRKVLPEKLVYKMARARNVGVQLGVYRLSRQRPKAIRRLLLMAAKRQLGSDFDMRHFSPSYNPWDERLCAVPNGDLFKVLKEKQASVVTDHIESFTEQGIRLKSGKELQADVVVTATGLDMKIFGGVTPVVDGKEVKVGECLTYKGSMVSGMPNFSMTFGYTNSSWTLKADLIAEFCCRLINYMDKQGIPYCVPEAQDDDFSDEPFLDLQSGYVSRARHLLPRQGKSGPWKVIQSYLHDTSMIRFSKVNEPGLRFAKPSSRKKKVAAFFDPASYRFS